jgi:tetratricopeptide (TPR) repeat protein
LPAGAADWAPVVTGTAGRWTRRRVAGRLQLARYWQRHGDLDEAGRHAGYAARLIRARPVPVPLAVEVALVVAAIGRDLDLPGARRAALEWAVATLDAKPAGAARDRQVAGALTDLGDCHRRAARYPLALDALRRARQLLEGATETAQLAATSMMSGIVAKELGEFEAAAHWYGRAAAGIAPHSADAAALQHNLAGLAYAQGRHEVAEQHARRAVALRRGLPGATEVDVALDLAVLASAVAGQQRHDEARALLEEAMAACQRARPPRRYEIAVHLHNLAAIDQASGRTVAAERGYRRTLSLKEELLGPEHPEVALVANNLATLLSGLGRGPEAAELYRRALAIVARSYPPEHPTSCAIRANAASAGVNASGVGRGG